MVKAFIKPALVALLSCILSTAISALPKQDHIPDSPIKSEAVTFSIEKVAEGFDTPWTMTFLSGTSALVGDRKVGRLSLLDVNTGAVTEITGLPDMLRDSEISSGLFDVKVDPDFAKNGWVYLVHGIGSKKANGLAVVRMTLKNTQLSNPKRLFISMPLIAGKWHFGGRLVLKGDYLFLSTGDGYEFKQLSQDLSVHAGKILRLHRDGRVPSDNPFVNNESARPEIWAYGVRNPQGMTLHPKTGELWTHEHGPQGGDEINIIQKGKNYGWPIITYGEEYGGGPIGDGITHKDGMEQPLYYWVPSIAPSGMSFYSGKAIPEWRGNLFIGALALTHLNRLVIKDGKVVKEERLFTDEGWRVRFVTEGPDGFLYFGVDEGMILRLRPVR